MGSGREGFAAADGELWYKDAIIYQLHVRAFYDSDADGIGDFRGLTAKLDYLQDLGVTALWLLPFYRSPLRDDGYDISDYSAVHPNYGTLGDFKEFLREAHRRGLRVITELVVNHTSEQHAWFQRARRAKAGSRWRDFYVWSDTPQRYRDARIIFKDFESSNWTWDPVAGAYYWHRFYSHQPDLNFENPEVRRAIFRVLNSWLRAGVDGLRLDAVPYLFEREGTNCENLPETHAMLKELRRHIDANHGDRMLLAEANQWPEDAVAYFGDGDECHTAFHFPLMPRMFMALRMEDRFPIVDILEQTPAIPEACQWVLFLRNHDELTLEMVTDAERDYMYRAYAQDPAMRINLGIRRRLAALLGNDRRRMELMNGLLLSLPGTPVIYYGDELGMGDNFYLGDRNGVRTPMQWSSDRNAGFSTANPQKLYLPIIIDPEYHYETINVEAQHNNRHSFLWWMRRLIGLRRQFKAFGRGDLQFLYPENPKVLAFVRRYDDENLLVVANLSRFAQHAELNLSEFNGQVPVELFGHAEFPAIGELPYLLTLGPHGFYWFSIEPRRIELATGVQEAAWPTLVTTERWEAILAGRVKTQLEKALPAFLRTRRWFGAKARTIDSAAITEVFTCPGDWRITVVQVQYRDGEPENYLLPLARATGDDSDRVLAESPQAVIARLRTKGDDEASGVLYDGTSNNEFCASLLKRIAARRRWKGTTGELVASTTRALRRIGSADEVAETVSLVGVEQSNTSIVYGERFILKLYRRLEPAVNPDLEIGRFLTEHVSFPHVPPVAGAIELHRRRGEPISIAVLHGFVPNEGDAWRFTLDSLGRYFEHVVTLPADSLRETQSLPQAGGLPVCDADPPPLACETIGTYLQAAHLLGVRTAQLHLALASGSEEPGFAPEPFSSFHQRSLYQTFRNTAQRVLQLLRKRQRQLPEEIAAVAAELCARDGEIKERFATVLDAGLSAQRIRCHGDFHLGQVLYTGKDFVIMDFEGEPARPLAERKLKGSPLRDVAGMLRSLHYAAFTALDEHPVLDSVPPSLLEPWARFWYAWVSSAFYRAYLETAADAPFLPERCEDRDVFLRAFVLEKALYELGYELNNRPQWVKVPLRGVADLLEATA